MKELYPKGRVYDTPGIPCVCKRCNHKWDYHGKAEKVKRKYPVYICCPRCRTSVRLR